MVVILMAGKKIGKTEFSVQLAYEGRGSDPKHFNPDSITHFSKRYGNLQIEGYSNDKAYQADFKPNATDIYEGNFFPFDGPDREPTSRLPSIPPSNRFVFCLKQL